jgi:MFS family permease
MATLTQLRRLATGPETLAGTSGVILPVAAVAFAAFAFAFAFQETSILPTLTRIEGTLPGATTSTVTFLESGYLVVSAVAAPTLGKLGDREGRKLMMLFSMSMYFAGALGASLTPDFAGLVIFRAVQGVGGAIFALAMALIQPLAGDRLPIAVSGIVAGFGFGITAGFASAGVITADLGWRWLFGIEGVLITVAMLLIVLFVPDRTGRQDVGRDLPGAALLGFGLASLLLALTFGPPWGWTSWPVLFLFAVSPVMLAGWWIRENRTAQPLLDVGLLKSPAILFPNLAGALAGYAAFSTYILVPRFAEVPSGGPLGYGFGFGLTEVGLLMMPIGVGTLFGSATGGALAGRFGGRWPFAGGMLVLALGPALLAAWRPGPYAVGSWLFVTGLGFGMSVGAANTFVIEAAPPNATAVSTSYNILARLFGGGLGSQIAIIILLAYRVPGYSGVSRQAAFPTAFAIAAAVALGGAFLASLTRVSDDSG